MKLKHDKSLLSPDDRTELSRIECSSFSPNMTRLAVCTSSNNQVILFDANSNDKKDKFGLKSTGKNFSRKSFVVKGIAFSPDSLKLAVGQTDCVIYVYKIGENWAEKKSIIGKYTLQNPVTCLLWHELGIVFGSIDGKVKVVQTQSNKMLALMTSNTMVISMCNNNDSIVAGYLSGLIMINSINSRDGIGKQLSTHSCPPFALTISSSGFVCAAGCDGRISFFSILNQQSNQRSSNINKQNIEYGSDISSAISSPSGNIIILSSLEKLLVFELDSRVWRQKNTIELCGSLLITGLQWSIDGTKILATTLNGGAELFACKWKSKLISDRIEINYIGNKQVVIKDLQKGTSAVFHTNYDIKDIKIIKENFVVIWTNCTLIIGDISDPNNSASEIEWSGMTTEGVKFCFDYENVALINVAGELYLVEFGCDQILASVRTDFVNQYLMSVRINERKCGAKVLAYLLDIKTISILDLISGAQVCVLSHTERIDWIELNETGRKLLFRDKTLKLNLLDILTQENNIILNSCGFVQWVPGSDVIVAQSRDKLYVYYDFDKPVIHNISGGSRNDAIGIEREQRVTTVKFSMPSTDIILDEVLLEFDTAIEDLDLNRAESFLEDLPLTAESESMWRLLGNVALKHSALMIAERAFATIGDITKANFVRECNDEPNKLFLLENDWTSFESGKFDESIDMYIKLHKWELAIDLAMKAGRLDVKENLEEKYYNWLIDTSQEAEAAQIKEKAGKHEEAIRLYLKSGLVIHASKLILNNYNKRGFNLNKQLVEQVISELISSSFFEEAGDLYEINLINDKSSALENYIKGNAFTKAINLARIEFPDEVVKLESKFAEYLMNECRDPSAAVNHFIEAGKTVAALECAIQASQYDRAAEIAAILDNIPPHLGKKIGNYYASKEQIDTAVELYLNCGCIRDAVALLNNKGQYSRAYKLARKLMDATEAKEMYESIAKSLENNGKYKEAERIYITCDDPDSAISMYKTARQYESMIRLVKQYHSDLLTDTHLHLAKELENEGSLHQAETHYVAANEWKLAIQMYKKCDQWEEAYRVSRTHGGINAAKQVAYYWALSLKNADAAVKLLSRFGLLNQVVDYAVESNEFEFATQLIANSGNDLKHKMIEVNIKYALWLEDNGKLSEAEAMFVSANKAKEAVLMYLHNGSFDDALRVAEQFVRSEDCIRDVLTAQAKHIMDRSKHNLDDMNRAESLLLRAGRIEIAVKMYKENGMWDEAIRVCDQYAPHLVESVKREMILENRNNNSFIGGTITSESSGRSVGRMARDSDNREQTNAQPLQELNDFRQNLKVAELNNDRDSIVKYTLLLASQLIKEKSLSEALTVLNKYNAVYMLPETKKFVLRIAGDLFAFDAFIESELNSFKLLRECLFQVIGSSVSDSELEVLEKYLFVSHLFTLKLILAKLSNQSNAYELYTKITTSLLRYTDIVRVDMAFYEAGNVAKQSARLEMAFVFWNHFLDLVDAIEDGEYNVDHSDFVETDIPFEVPLPSQPFCAPNIVEEVKSWILQISMDSQVSQSLPLDAYREGDVYEASLINSDSSTCLPCLVTGYPVIKHKMLEFKPGKYVVNKDDWNKLLMLTKVTDDENLKDVLHFIGKLCGNASVARFSFQ